MLPSLYNSTAGAAALLSLTCSSGTNATITSNKTRNLDFAINMSSVYNGSSRTCPYGADNIGRIENTNVTYGCDVLVYDANFTSSRNITIDISEAISFASVSNIPAALAAAGIATLIVIYTVRRIRRTE